MTALAGATSATLPLLLCASAALGAHVVAGWTQAPWSDDPAGRSPDLPDGALAPRGDRGGSDAPSGSGSGHLPGAGPVDTAGGGAVVSPVGVPTSGVVGPGVVGPGGRDRGVADPGVAAGGVVAPGGGAPGRCGPR